MNRTEFTIRPVNSMRLGMVRLELDSDAREMLDAAFSDIYADRGGRDVADMLIQLALRDLSVLILHRRNAG